MGAYEGVPTSHTGVKSALQPVKLGGREEKVVKITYLIPEVRHNTHTAKKNRGLRTNAIGNMGYFVPNLSQTKNITSRTSPNTIAKMTCADFHG